MSPKTSSAEAAPAGADQVLSFLSAREQRFLVQGILTIPDFPAGLDIDYALVAERMGLKNPRSVSNAFSDIKKKIAAFVEKNREEHDEAKDAEDDEGGEAAAGTPADPTTPSKAPGAKRGRAATTKVATPKATPTKRGRASTAGTPTSGKRARKDVNHGQIRPYLLPALRPERPGQEEDNDDEEAVEEEHQGNNKMVDVIKPEPEDEVDILGEI